MKPTTAAIPTVMPTSTKWIIATVLEGSSFSTPVDTPAMAQAAMRRTALAAYFAMWDATLLVVRGDPLRPKWRCHKSPAALNIRMMRGYHDWHFV
jgi:hypothetical protein